METIQKQLYNLTMELNVATSRIQEKAIVLNELLTKARKEYTILCNNEMQKAKEKNSFSAINLPKHQEIDVLTKALQDIDTNVSKVQTEVRLINSIIAIIKRVREYIEIAETDVCTYIQNRSTQLEMNINYNTSTEGFTYVIDSTGKKMYTALYTNVSQADYDVLIDNLGVNAVIGLMFNNGCDVQSIKTLIQGRGYQYSIEQIQSIAEKSVYVDIGKETKTKAESVLARFEDTNATFSNGTLQTGCLSVKTDWKYAQSKANTYNVSNKESACAVYTYATALSIKTGKTITPEDISRAGNVCNWQTQDGTYKSTVVSGLTDGAIREVIEEELAVGHPIVVHSGTHYATIIGKDESGEYIINDPWYGENCNINEMQCAYKQNGKVIFDQYIKV